jgi:sulfate adenylyltransferase subunit 2
MATAPQELFSTTESRNGNNRRFSRGLALRLSHLKALEAESIYILREAAGRVSHPVMLYSIGKDSSVRCAWRRKRSSRKDSVPPPPRG